MKKLLLLFVISFFFSFSTKAQTATELLGKWKLVKWTKKGNDKPVTDSTFQVFNNNGKFISIVGVKEHKGKWKLSKDNTMLTIRSGLIVVYFSVDYFDTKKRVITADELGTLEYQKVEP